MSTEGLIKSVRDIARIGIVNAKIDKEVLLEAADRLETLDRKAEDLEERVAIMMEANRIQPGAAIQTEMDPYEYRDEIRH